MSTETEMTREELEAALSIATENRRILAQAVLNQHEMPCETGEQIVAWDAEYGRMLSLAKEMVK